MKRIVTSLLLILFVTTIPYSQTFNTINLEFTRTVIHENTKEITQGTIYYDSAKTTLKVNKPINQWMILEGNHILIYYPDELRAIKIESNNPSILPFFQAFAGVAKEDYGLSELGYVIKKSEVKGDTLFTYWSPPKEVKKILGEFILAYEKDRFIFTEARDTNGKIVVRTTYHDHFLHGATYFPLHIISLQNTKNYTTIEDVIYSNPIFDKPFPSQVVNFTIPAGTKIEVMEW